MSKVEWQNNLAINVYRWNKGVIIHYISKQHEEIPHINLLLVENAGTYHYTYIRDFNHLLYEQSKKEHCKYFYKCCLHGFSREDLLEKYE